jgi:hypothetical protein
MTESTFPFDRKKALLLTLLDKEKVVTTVEWLQKHYHKSFRDWPVQDTSLEEVDQVCKIIDNAKRINHIWEYIAKRASWLQSHPETKTTSSPQYINSLDALSKFVLVVGGNDDPNEMTVDVTEWKQLYQFHDATDYVFSITLCGTDKKNKRPVQYEFFFERYCVTFLATASWTFSPFVTQFSEKEPLAFAMFCKVIVGCASLVAKQIRAQIVKSGWGDFAVHFCNQCQLLGSQQQAKTFMDLAPLSLDHYPFAISDPTTLIILGMTRGQMITHRIEQRSSRWTDTKCLQKKENDCNTLHNRSNKIYSYKKIGQHVLFYLDEKKDDGLYMFGDGVSVVGTSYPYREIILTLAYFPHDNHLEKKEPKTNFTSTRSARRNFHRRQQARIKSQQKKDHSSPFYTGQV